MVLSVKIEELSRYLDGEVTPEERTDIERRLASCESSRKILARLREAMREIAQSILEQPTLLDNAPTDACFDDQTLAKLADNLLAPAELYPLEAHAAACPYCLRRLLETMRSAVTVEVSNWQELPEQVRSDVRLAPLKKIKPKPKKLERAAALRQDIVCALNEMAGVRQEFTIGDYTVKVGLMPQRGGFANIEIAVLLQNKPQSQVEISVTISGVVTQVFRGTTSLDGRVLLRRLRDGAYDIWIGDANMMITANLIAAAPTAK